MLEPRSTPWRTRALLGALYLGVSMALLVASGALDSGFGGFEDEPGHLMSALLVRDYLAAGLPGSPLDYARDYYVHYPKVALGHWPPALPAALGLWMLALGTSHLAILSFFCVLAAATALAIHAGARHAAGELPAAAAGLLFLLLPPVQLYGHMAMTELPLALTCTLAVLAFGRYLETARARHAMAFGLLAALAIMTKGTGLFLAFVPLLAIPLAGAWHLLRRPATWGAAALVALLCAPWYALTLGISRSSWVEATPGAAYIRAGLVQYPLELLWIAGLGVAACAIAGFAVALSGDGRRGRWAALAAWVPALLACCVLIPTGIQARHLVVLAPVWLMAAAVGLRYFSARPLLRPAGLPLAPLVVLASLALVLRIEHKDLHGHDEAAQRILSRELPPRAVLLVSSDSIGEGLFVTSVALQEEERPGHVVLRASKVLACSDWFGRGYEVRFESAEAVRGYLAEVPVDVVVLDESGARAQRFPHDELLREAVEGDPERWVPLGAYDLVRGDALDPGALRLFRQRVPPDHPRPQISYEDVIGRPVPLVGAPER